MKDGATLEAGMDFGKLFAGASCFKGCWQNCAKFISSSDELEE